MTEHIADERLSLYATEDLVPEEQRSVAAHVEACAKCRTTVAEFRETQRFLNDSLADPGAADLLAVREGVSERLRQPRNAARRWAWGLAAAAAMLAFLIAALRFESHPAMPPRPSLAVARLAPPKEALSRPAEVPVSHTRHARHRDAGIRSVALITRAHQPPVIKMTTADPNVVILWQSNQTEDE